MTRHKKKADFLKRTRRKTPPTAIQYSCLSPLPLDHSVSTQPPQDQVTKKEEDRNPAIEYPFILHSPPLDHPNCIPTHSQCICDVVKLSLSVFQYLPLFTQVRQHSPASIEEVVELVVRTRHEIPFPEHMIFLGERMSLSDTAGRREGRMWRRDVSSMCRIRIGVLGGRR